MRRAAEILSTDLHVFEPQEGLRRVALLMQGLGLAAFSMAPAASAPPPQRPVQAAEAAPPRRRTRATATR